jgi:hypothetical protein
MNFEFCKRLNLVHFFIQIAVFCLFLYFSNLHIFLFQVLSLQRMNLLSYEKCFIQLIFIRKLILSLVLSSAISFLFILLVIFRLFNQASEVIKFLLGLKLRADALVRLEMESSKHRISWHDCILR